MSLMEILNKRGTRIDPCGTLKSVLHPSLKLLFTLWNYSDLNKFYHVERKAIRI